MSNTLRPGDVGGLRISKARDQAPNLNCLFYGDVGVGKTRLAGSADAVSELSPVLVLDAEGGTFTLRDTYPGCEVIRVKDWKEIDPVYQELRAGLHQYRTVVVDSLTELQIFNMDEVMAWVQQRDPERFDKQGDGEVASMLEWQINSKKIRQMIRVFRDLPMTVIFTALVKEDKNKQTGAVQLRPNLPGKLAINVAGMFDEVLYMYVAEQTQKDAEGNDQQITHRMLLTQPTAKITAKDRSNKLPKPYMRNPTMADIYKYAVGENSD